MSILSLQPEFDFKDWYCFECHLAGDVNVCENCFRVFHFDCIKIAKKRFNIHKAGSSLRSNDQSTTTSETSPNASESHMDISTSSNAADKSAQLYNEKLCSVCNIIHIDDSKLDKSEMNYLLKFVLHRIRTWVCGEKLWYNLQFLQQWGFSYRTPLLRISVKMKGPAG